jgi:transcriptional regulator with XRE-family HTH domain
MKTWNERITEAREARQLTKAELARACEVAGATVTGWESGDIKELTALKALKICEALRVDPWWLVLGKGKFNAPNTEEKRPLTQEASKLILWVERVDGLGDPARKLFLHLNAALHVAGTLTQAQNPSPKGADIVAGAGEKLASFIDQSGGKESATRKHKP